MPKKWVSDPSPTATPAERIAGDKAAGRRAVLALVLLIALLFAYRLLTLPLIEVGGDAAYMWNRSKNFPANLASSEWWHQSARVAITMVTAAFQGVFGTHPTVAYLPPLFMSAVQIVFTFLLCRRAAGTAAAVLACLGLILHPQLVRNGAQLLPGVFSGAFMVGALYYVSRCFAPVRGALVVNIGIAAALFFAAYLSKVTNLFFLPALVLAVWSIRGNPVDALPFLGILAALFAVEWVFYALIVGGYDFGRLSVIQSHFDYAAKWTVKDIVPYLETLAWSDLLLTRYSVLFLGGPPQAIAFYVAIVCAAGVLLLERRADSSAALTAYSLLSFVLLLAFAVIRIDPLIPAQRFNPRFLAVLVPMMMIVIAILAARIGHKAVGTVGAEGTRSTAGLVVSAALMSPLMIYFALANGPAYLTSVDRHSIVVLNRYADLVDRAAAKCMPIVFSNDRAGRLTRWIFFDNTARFAEIPVGRGGIYSLGFTGNCRKQFQDLATYLEATGDVSEVPGIAVVTDRPGQRAKLEVFEMRLSLDDIRPKAAE